MDNQNKKPERDVLAPLTEQEIVREKQLFSDERIKAAVEKGQKALAALEASSRYQAIINPKVRFS